MAELQNQRKRMAWPSLIGRCAVSCMMVLLTQFALSLVPRFLSASPLLIQLSLSGPTSFSLPNPNFYCVFVKNQKGRFQFSFLVFYNSCSDAGGGGSRWAVQTASWNPCLGPGFRFLQYTVHLVFLCYCYPKR